VKLILNAEALRPPITGVGNYTWHLLEQFVQFDHIDEVRCFTGTGWVTGEEQLAVTAAVKAAGGSGRQSVKERAVSRLRTAIGHIPGTKALYSKVMDGRFQRFANNLSSAVYHETNYVLKPFAGTCLTTVHDLSHVRFPQYHPQHLVDWLDRFLPGSLARADCIITVSDLVRKELMEHYNLPEHKVKTVYEGVESYYRPRTESETSSVLSALKLKHKQYVLLVATLEPRKGIDLLLDAWCLLPDSLRREYPLILAGSSGWRNSALVERIAKLSAQGSVRHLGYVRADILPVLFSGAAVFAYPSVYEGFGLPVLDAMSSGVPVICRADTSMAEFSQGACVLCDTSEPEELAYKLQSLLASQSLRDSWAEKGLRQAAHFSWERCAKETAEIYRQLS
jgi:glycosyltransferase involved in cell wall biosynthesis